MASLREGAWRHQAWLALLVVAISGFSLVYACAIPFAAFAVMAAMTLSRGDAYRTTIVLWLVNQVIGYIILGYPWTVNSFSWGIVIGVVASLCTMTARWIVARLRMAWRAAQALVALGAAFAVYEVALYGVAVAGLGGTGTFVLPLDGRILIVNAAALVGLYGLHWIGAAVGLRHRRVFPVAARPA